MAFPLINMIFGMVSTPMKNARQINAVSVIGPSSSPLCTRLKHVSKSRCRVHEDEAD